MLSCSLPIASISGMEAPWFAEVIAACVCGEAISHVHETNMGASHFTILDFAVTLLGSPASSKSTTFIAADYLTPSLSPHSPPAGSPADLRPAARVDRRGEVSSPQQLWRDSNNQEKANDKTELF